MYVFHFSSHVIDDSLSMYGNKSSNKNDYVTEGLYIQSVDIESLWQVLENMNKIKPIQVKLCRKGFYFINDCFLYCFINI